MTPVETRGATRSITVLVVEDEPDLRTCIEYNLAGAGYRPLAAGDGATGLEMIQRERPDLGAPRSHAPGLRWSPGVPPHA